MQTPRLMLLVSCFCAVLPACGDVTSVPLTTDAMPLEDRWPALDVPKVTYFAVAGATDGSEVYIVGEQGTILRGDAAGLKQESSGTTVALRGVAVAGVGEAFAVGDAGTILHRSAVGWVPEADGLATEVLTSVWVDSAQVAAVGETGTFLVRQDDVWKRIANDYLEDLLAVSGGESIAAVGALGILLTLSGDTLQRQAIPQFNKPLAGATTGPAGRWFVGLDGAVFQGQPGSLRALDGLPPVFLRSVTAPGPDVWVVGWDGVIVRFISGTPNRVAPYDDRWMNGVYASSSSDVWIVGCSGLVLHGPPTRLLPDAGGDR